MSLYGLCKLAGLQMDHYESDLYVRESGEAWELINQYQRQHGFHTARRFIDSIDGDAWIEIPFAYQPWWDERAAQVWRPESVA